MRYEKLLESTSLYEYLRDIRVANNELLKDMADKLGLGYVELSSIELGKTPMPEGFLEQVREVYKLEG